MKCNMTFSVIENVALASLSRDVSGIGNSIIVLSQDNWKKCNIIFGVM